MATLGTALLGSLMGHTDAEKMFRPWWDTLEDFVIYGLIMLGLIISPTTIFNGTPLYCTPCISAGQCGDKPSNGDPPEHHAWWVKTFCTHSALGKFTLYFPYILLIAALVLTGIERFFNKIFKSNIQVDGFYSLLLTAKRLDTEEGSGEMRMEDTIHTVEVRQSFKNHSTFFKSYLVRTVFECLCSLLIAGYLALSGISELMNWNNLDLQEKTELIRNIEVTELINVRRDKVRVFCDVHGSWYECSGVPTQFYLYVLIASLALLLVYLATTFLTICWLLCPCLGTMAKFMRNYESEMEHASAASGEKASGKELLGEMHEIYYGNRDLRLLLDLLAATTGLAPPLRVMALLDKQFRNACKPIINSLERTPDIVNGEGDIVLDFSESITVRNIFSKLGALQCLYTVQIIPRTDQDSVEVFVFEPEEHKFLSSISLFRKSDKNEADEIPSKNFVFKGADADITYTVKVTLVLNGRAIAAVQKKLKALPKVEPQVQDEKHNMLVSQLNVQALAAEAGLEDVLESNHHHHHRRRHHGGSHHGSSEGDNQSRETNVDYLS